jgi:hypothetical protein
MRKLEILDAEISNGTIIKFVSEENINTNDKLSITFEGKEHYFDVKSIKTNFDYDKLLHIEAVETGYTRSYFNRMKEFDLRNILGLSITIIRDEEKLKSIRKSSCLC